MFKHGIKNNEQFTHTSGQGYLFDFTSCQQSLTEGADYGIVATGNQFCLYQGGGK